MSTVITKPSAEVAERARERYRRDVQALVEANPDNLGKMLALDADTGAYEIAETILLAVDRLKERLPNARPFAIRVGQPTTTRIGAGGLLLRK